MPKQHTHLTHIGPCFSGQIHYDTARHAVGGTEKTLGGTAKARHWGQGCNKVWGKAGGVPEAYMGDTPQLLSPRLYWAITPSIPGAKYKHLFRKIISTLYLRHLWVQNRSKLNIHEGNSTMLTYTIGKTVNCKHKLSLARLPNGTGRVFRTSFSRSQQ